MCEKSEYSKQLFNIVRRVKEEDIKTSITIIDEYIQKQYNSLHNLLSRPTDVLKELEDFYRLENPHKDGQFYLPDATTFYRWIVKKFQHLKIKFNLKNEKGGNEITEYILLKNFSANSQGNLLFFYMTGFRSKIGLKRKDNKMWKVYFMRNNQKLFIREIETIQEFIDIFKAIDGGYPALFNTKNK